MSESTLVSAGAGVSPTQSPPAASPKLLVLTPDTGLMLRLVNTAEGEGWEAVWRPDLDLTPESTGNWDAVAVDADFGTAAFQAAHGLGLRLIAVIGWWDQREVELSPLCAGFLHRPLRPSEVAGVLASTAAPVRPAQRRG